METLNPRIALKSKIKSGAKVERLLELKTICYLE